MVPRQTEIGECADKRGRRFYDGDGVAKIDRGEDDLNARKRDRLYIRGVEPYRLGVRCLFLESGKKIMRSGKVEACRQFQDGAVAGVGFDHPRLSLFAGATVLRMGFDLAVAASIQD